MGIKDKTVLAVRNVSLLDILDSEGVKYKKVGYEAITLCPWHDDKNPSLTINDEKGLCFCFVCNGGSDGISYVQQKLGLSFREAVERIASKHGVPIEYDDVNPEEIRLELEKRKSYIDSLEQQQEVFRENLRSPRASRIRSLLTERGILPDASRHFGLGYASDGFFGGRITIPILDHRGNLVGFSGRSASESVTPKYKNSENNDYFKKSLIVYNEYNALQHIREADSIIFVEGHFDVISLWQEGIRNVVAMQGTGAPDESVIKRLARRTKRFILCYDGDSGGTKAVEQFIKVAGPMACRGEITISICDLPEGKDPDECIRDESIDFYSLIVNAPPWLDWQLDTWIKQVDFSDTSKFAALEKAIRAFVNSIQSPALRQFYIDKASKALTNSITSAAKLAKTWTAESVSRTSIGKWSKPSPLEAREAAEKRLLRLYIHAPETRPYCAPMMDKLQSPAYRWLWGRLKELEECGHGMLTPHSVMAILLVAEPHYMRQLRAVAVPTIKIKNNRAIIRHIEDTLSEELLADV